MLHCLGITLSNYFNWVTHSKPLECLEDDVYSSIPKYFSCNVYNSRDSSVCLIPLITLCFASICKLVYIYILVSGGQRQSGLSLTTWQEQQVSPVCECMVQGECKAKNIVLLWVCVCKYCICVWALATTLCTIIIHHIMEGGKQVK